MSINPRPCHSEPVTDVTGVGIRNLLAGNLRKSAGIIRFGNGLPRQCVPQGNLLSGAKRRGNPFPARHRRADGTSGTPSPTERFDALRAGRGSEFKPARGTFQKEYPILSDGVFFLERATRLELASRHPANGIAIRRNPVSPPDLTRFAQVEAASSPVLRHIPKRIPHPTGWGILFGAGDEARTRYLDLGKVALYQMSYARKMVPQAGVEPATRGFSVRCSTN